MAIDTYEESLIGFLIALKSQVNKIKSTVKPEYNDQPWDSKKVAVVQRRPLLGGSKNENDKQ